MDATILTSAFNSSIRQLASMSEYSFEQLIRGSVSLGAIFQNYEQKAVPSPQFKSPNEKKYYYGGFITFSHGSKDCPAHRVNAIQIELPALLRSNENYVSTAKMLAKIIYDYYRINKFGKLLDKNSKKCF